MLHEKKTGYSTFATNVQLSVDAASSYGDDLTLAVLEYDELAVDLLSRIPAYDVGRVDRVELDLPALHERPAEDDVEVRLLRQVDGVDGPRAAHRDWPFP